jgi:hypothetical protein
MLHLSKPSADLARRLAAVITHWWPITLGVLGPSLLAVASVSPHAHSHLLGQSWSWRTHLVEVGILCSVVAGGVVGRRQLRLDRVAVENALHADRAEAGALALLRAAFHELVELADQAKHFSNERVSLYRCESDHFVLLARRSRDPVREQSTGRTQYPLHEGCLGHAWREGRSHEAGLPPAGSGAPWNEQWLLAQHDRWGLPEATAAGLVMPSRCYVAFRIETRLRPLGVLVFESVNTMHEVEETGSQVCLDLARLERLQRRSAASLAVLLRESTFIDAATIARLRLDVARTAD